VPMSSHSSTEMGSPHHDIKKEMRICKVQHVWRSYSWIWQCRCIFIYHIYMHNLHIPTFRQEILDEGSYVQYLLFIPNFYHRFLANRYHVHCWLAHSYVLSLKLEHSLTAQKITVSILPQYSETEFIWDNSSAWIATMWH
jgi:hypothetical protein